jgi:CRISPR-associated exonuclease Cas4
MVARVIIAGVLLALFGLALVIRALWMRRARGLSSGQTISLDNVTLFSKEHLLVGRPDRIVKQGGFLVPEEWKSSRKVEPWHIAQLGTYFILAEEAYGVRPPYGVIMLGDGVRKRIENTEELRKQVLDVARRIREARRRLDSEIPVAPKRWQCRACGQRSRCGQAQ